MNKSSNKSNYNRLFLAEMLAVAVMASGLVGCLRDESVDSGLGTEAREVGVATVSQRDFERQIVTTGSLQAQQSAMVRAISGGPLEVVPVEIGDIVSEGEVLFQVRLVDAELAIQSAEAGLRTAEANLADLRAWQRQEEVETRRASLNQAEAEYERLARDRDRMETLFERGSVSQSEWDMARTAAESANAALESAKQQMRISETGPTQEQIAVVQAQVAQAEAAVDQARQILQDATIRAPFDGVVTQRLKKAGDFVNRAEPVIELANIETLEAEMRVPESYASMIENGSELDVIVEAIHEVHPGAVFAVSESIDQATRTFQVKVAVDNSDRSIKTGMFCTGEFHLPNKVNVPAVPLDALVQEEGRYYVWVAENSNATRIEVEIGEEDGEYREILSGVETGDQVIVEGKGALTEGADIVLQENNDNDDDDAAADMDEAA